jgi:hypothetical protein
MYKGTMYKVTDIEKFTKKTIIELDNYTREKNKEKLAFGIGPLVQNQFESTQYGSETPKNLRRTFESILTEVIDSTKHYQSVGDGVCNQNPNAGKKIDEELQKKHADNLQDQDIKAPPLYWIDMVISGEYSWYEKYLETDQYTISPIIIGTSTDVDITLGNYKSTSKGEVVVTVMNCDTKKLFSVREQVDIFERSSDNSIYLFSNQFGIVWISKGKKRGSVNIAMQEALKVAMLKALILATGKNFDDIKNFVNFHKILRESMDKIDQQLLSETLEFDSATNEPVIWRNRNSGNFYTIRPRRKYYRDNKQPCVEFSAEVKIKGKLINSEYEYLVACRE